MDERSIKLTQEYLRNMSEARAVSELEATIGQTVTAGIEGIAEQIRIDHLVEEERQQRHKEIQRQEESRIAEERQRETGELKIKSNIETKETKTNIAFLSRFAELCLPRTAEPHDDSLTSAKEPKTFTISGADEDRLRALQSSVLWLPVPQTKRTQKSWHEEDDGFCTNQVVNREIYGVHPVFVVGSKKVDRNETALLGVSALSRGGKTPSVDRDVDIHRIIFGRNFRKFQEYREDIAGGSFVYTRADVETMYNPNTHKTLVSEGSSGSLSTSGRGDSQKVKLFYNTVTERVTKLTDEMMATYRVVVHLADLALKFDAVQNLDGLLEAQKTKII